MPHFFSRLIAGAIVAVAICTPALADPQTPAAQGVPIPRALAPSFEKLGLKDVASIAYQGEDGKPLDEAAFLARFKGGFKMKKEAGKGGLPAVTVILMSKNEVDGKFSKLKAGDAAPEFHLALLNGTPFDNTSLEGHYTLVSFYNAGCGPCIHEIPVLNELAQQRKDVNMIAITDDNDKVSRNFVAEHGLNWRVVPNASKLMKAIGVHAYPTMALIDAQGKLVDSFIGERNLVTLNKWLDERAGAAKPLTQGQPIPDAIGDLLKYHQAEKFSRLFFSDEDGKPINANAFAAQIKAGKKYAVGMQKRIGADPDIRFQIMSKDAQAAAVAPPNKVKPGEAFPEFHLTRLDGTGIDNKALLGRYTLVSFYFAACGPCVKEVPTLNALAEKRKDLNLLAVTFDSFDESRQFVKQHHLNWTIVPNAKKLADDAGVTGYPLFALLDPQGKLVEMVYPGVITEGGATIDAWLDKKIAPAN